jgi:hypothetical protein
MGSLPFGDISAADRKRNSIAVAQMSARDGNRRRSCDWQVEDNCALGLTLNFDYFCVVFVRIYDRNDYHRISLLNRRASGFRRFFAVE